MLDTIVNAQNIIITIFRLGVTVLVPAVVWVTLLVGFVQLGTQGLRRLNAALPGLPRFARRPAR